MSANDNNDNEYYDDDDDEGDDGETTKVVESKTTTTVNRRILDAAPTTKTDEQEELNNAVSSSKPTTTTKTASNTGGGPSRSEKRQHSKSSSNRKQTSSNQTAAAAAAASASTDETTNAADGCLDLDVKKTKKEPKASPPTDGAASLRQAYQTFPASSYLQGLTALAHPYAGLFTTDPGSVAGGAAAFLTEPHFASYQTASADLQRSLAESGKNKESLLGALNQVDASSLRHLIIGYREAAALLNRTADELENYLCTRK